MCTSLPWNSPDDCLRHLYTCKSPNKCRAHGHSWHLMPIPIFGPPLGSGTVKVMWMEKHFSWCLNNLSFNFMESDDIESDGQDPSPPRELASFLWNRIMNAHGIRLPIAMIGGSVFEVPNIGPRAPRKCHSLPFPRRETMENNRWFLMKHLAWMVAFEYLTKGYRERYKGEFCGSDCSSYWVQRGLKLLPNLCQMPWHF